MNRKGIFWIQRRVLSSTQLLVCSGCKQAKEYLNNKNVSYLERDIEADIKWADVLSELSTSQIPTLITTTITTRITTRITTSQKAIGFNKTTYDYILEQ